MKTLSTLFFAQVRLALLLAVCCLALPAMAQSGTGSIRGRVANEATGDYLVGASVELRELRQSALTDASGTYEFSKVPAGKYTLQVFYTGLDAAMREITVTAEAETGADFNLQAAVYKLEKFVVTGDREGDAVSITRQRNADNVKNVLALDAFGSVANEDPSDLLIRLPGVTPYMGDEGDVFAVQVRGVDTQLNSVTVDGNRMSTSGAMTRGFRYGNITAVAFEELEVIKAPTPDLDADSIGGTINMKTKSALTMRDRQRLTYKVGVQWLHDLWGEQPPYAQRHDMHLTSALTYQGLFDAFGGKKNLAITVSGFYFDNGRSYSATTRNYAYTLDAPAYNWDYYTKDLYNLNRQQSLTLKVDYKMGKYTTLSVGGMMANATQDQKMSYQTRAYLNGGGTNGSQINAGYTDSFTEVSANKTSNSRFELETSSNTYVEKMQQMQVDLVRKKGPITIDASGAYSTTTVDVNSYDPDGGTIFTRMSSVGWSLDSSRSKAFPTLKMTAPTGKNMQNLNDYTTTQISKDDNGRESQIYSASLNAEYKAHAGYVPILIKVGARYRQQIAATTGGDRRWDYAGTDLAALQDYGAAINPQYGIDAPFIDIRAASRDVYENPAAWREDYEFYEQYIRRDDRDLREDVRAAYIMGRTKLGRLGVVAGVRFEDTHARAQGYVRDLITPGTDKYNHSQQAARAESEYGPMQVFENDYSDLFPSVHFTYSFTKNILFRASYSTSIGRPTPSNLIPNMAIASDYINLGNPDLLPQHSDNYDLSFEWYFEPVGQLSFGAFQKNLTDFSYTNTTGVAGQDEYAWMDDSLNGREIRTPKNGGNARIRGMEISWRQQLTFLPGFLKGTSVYANYTRLETEGDYGDGQRSENQLPKFVPESFNMGFVFKYMNFWGRISSTYTGEYLDNYSSDPSQNRYKCARTICNASVSYKVNKFMTLFCDMTNIFDTPQEWYRATGHPERLVYHIENGPKLTIGVNGRF
ncbi:TonB-dependent receptor [Termitidicoccus mucosus]|uniref:TonB-dependent receptor n=1 Tax=Termitidicoccus mucosus TaxID=1184151 RepID=A0A178IJG0_9BACT|nr:hypothetical protein AW736_11310 [Opitutaceae bacterium TSB47]